jgi:hypothetical protein
MIITLPLKGFEETAKARKEGYLEAVKSIGKILGNPPNQNVQLTKEDFDNIRAKYRLDEPALPSNTTMAGNALGAIARLGQAIVNRQPVLRSKEDQEKCLAICKGCEFYRASDGRCSQCGCVLSLKTRLVTDRCPLGKWNDGNAKLTNTY